MSRLVRAGQVRWIVVACAALIATGCDARTSQPTPTGTAPSAASHRAAAAYLLRGDQLRGYRHDGSQAITPQTLSDQENDARLIPELKADGFESGARERFVDPGKGAPTRAFATVFSQVIFFRDAAGATTYFAAESQRRQTQPTVGSLTTLALAPAGAIEQILGLQQEGSTPGSPQDQRAFLVLLRRGRLVASVFCQGDATTATPSALNGVVAAQEKQLSQPLD